MIYKDNLAAMAVREDVRNPRKRLEEKDDSGIKIYVHGVYYTQHQFYTISVDNKDRFLDEVKSLREGVLNKFKEILKKRAMNYPNPFWFESERLPYDIRGIWKDSWGDFRSCTLSFVRPAGDDLLIEILEHDSLSGLNPRVYLDLVKKHGKIVDSPDLARRTS